MGDTGKVAQGSAHVPPCSSRVIVSVSGSWSLFPLTSHPHGVETRGLLGTKRGGQAEEPGLLTFLET